MKDRAEIKELIVRGFPVAGKPFFFFFFFTGTLGTL